MYEMSKRDDVELTAVGLCGEDVLLNSIKSYLYVEDYKDRVAYKFDRSFESSLGLTSLYQKIFSTYFSKEFERVPKLGPKSVYVRGLTRILYRLQAGGVIKISPTFDPKSFDVF